MNAEQEGEAERLVREWVAGSDDGANQTRATLRLCEALQDRDDDRMVLWLNTCARLQATTAGPIVEVLLREHAQWPKDIRLAAMDAARAVCGENASMLIRLTHHETTGGR